MASFLKNFLVLLLGEVVFLIYLGEFSLEMVIYLFSSYFSGTIGCTICLGLILAIPVSMIGNYVLIMIYQLTAIGIRWRILKP